MQFETIVVAKRAAPTSRGYRNRVLMQMTLYIFLTGFSVHEMRSGLNLRESGLGTLAIVKRVIELYGGLYPSI